jgi:hypothetical protein
MTELLHNSSSDYTASAPARGGVVWRALNKAPYRADDGFVRDVTRENRIVASWNFEVFSNTKAVPAGYGRAALHVCASEGDDRHAGAFLEVQQWISFRGDEVAERSAYRRLAQGVLQRLRWLMSRLPNAWMLAPVPFTLRLLPTNKLSGAFDLARLHDTLNVLLDETECVPGLDVSVLHMVWCS